jgi:hypothetical protein
MGVIARLTRQPPSLDSGAKFEWASVKAPMDDEPLLANQRQENIGLHAPQGESNFHRQNHTEARKHLAQYRIVDCSCHATTETAASP